MDDRRFDALVKTLAREANRRSALKGLLGLAAGALAGATALRGGDAARRGYSGPKLFPTPTPQPTPPLGCAEGSSPCGSECCPNDSSMCCGSTCCFGACYGNNQCCASPHVFCGLSSTCCEIGALCCDNGGECYDTSKGQCCHDSDCPSGGKCCPELGCVTGPNACCSDSDCPSGDICTENNTCCHATCTAGLCNLDGCGRICPCPDGYSCLPNGTCARACEPGSLFCEEHACGSCWAVPDGSTGYCGGDTRGEPCDGVADCPAGQFCTIFNPPNHCVPACGA
jgi:hypothetical protein